LAAAILLISTVIVGLYLGEQTQVRFQNVETSWRNYSEQVARRGELLSRIRGDLGYGGVIHNFKNYVLRQDKVYLEKLKKRLESFRNTVDEYRKSGASQLELNRLATIENTFFEYEKNIGIATRAAREGWPPNKTDKLVKVDDTAAIQAMLSLDIYLQGKRFEAARAISNTVDEGNELVKTGFLFAGALAVVATILYGMFYLLLRQLNRTIQALSSELNERLAAELVAKKFQRAVEQSPATIIITDTDGIIEYVNNKFCRLTGYDASEVLGRTPKFLQSGDTSKDTYFGLSAQLASGETWAGTFRNMKKDGHSYWAKTVILPLRDDVGKISHFIGLGEDITEQKKASEHILRAQKMEAVGLLASGVAHDFNNVLTTILGNIHLAKLDAPQEGDFADELDQIEIAAKRAQHLVGQILAFARRQPGKAEHVRVGELMNEVMRLIRASVQPNIELEVSVERDDISVHADQTRLHQVLMNLCSNAAEAIGPTGGKIVLEAKIQDRKSTQERIVCISVTDNGPGIPEVSIEDIFTPFFTTKRAGKGTGLGLSVVASLVHEMDGEITVDSQTDQGCVFQIYLPLVKAASASIAPSKNLPHGSGRILLIDDEPEVIQACAQILTRLDYEVIAYTKPKDGVARFEQDPKPFDLVITDFRMPEMSGKDVCMAIRDVKPDCPIILYSAFRPEGMAFEPCEPIRFIEKPFDPAVLANSVDALLNDDKNKS